MLRLGAIATVGALAALYFVVWGVRRTLVSRARNGRRVRRSRAAHWGAIATAVTCAILIGGSVGVIGRHYMNAVDANAALPGVTDVQAQPLPLDTGPTPSPSPPPDRILLQVPYTTQAPLGNWAQHQESCEAATLTMVFSYWHNDKSVVIDPHVADASIAQIDGMKVQLDLTDQLLGQLALNHFGYSYRILPNTVDTIREQLSAGRPLIAEVRTHGLGNPNYPGYRYHYEQTGWSVPHFVVIIGYDSTGVWLNDAGISRGRGYHITYAQLAHAIDDLDQHHPNLAQGQVLLLIAPALPQKDRSGSV